ncbi:LacI family DNA-binding transcriptional regulator [Mycoplasma sp. Ms02]|uniref:LacI family DNA-binding transcriptional regulator n=1 Tax=Mycoplasma sp. Ms02 TaxID=353851 RepID=UPI001C894EA0|nr:LacI family DNA-binding transcriptional regulator [Mycoplasma sp. Ms02]QZE12659.1 LacI family transcriptional regulator [Mycoplasma sp. Ms02]
MKSISYKDISRLANVSISTVSRYYNNGYVSKRTKEKIERVVQENEYYPNHGARLIRGKDSSIFIIMPEWAQSIYISISNGIIQAAKLRKKKVHMSFSESGTKEYIETIKFILSWKPTSIVVFTPNCDKELADFLRSIQDVSIVIFGHEVDGLNYVKIDEEYAFYNLTKAFYAAIVDNKKMMFVSDAKLDPIQLKDRQTGFIRACKELGVDHEIYYLKAKSKNTIFELNKYTRKESISNLVCSTHEVFIALNALGDENLRLTDFGYQSIYDYIRTYKSKIFVDYPSIGFDIENMILNHSSDNVLKQKIIKPRIIS